MRSWVPPSMFSRCLSWASQEARQGRASVANMHTQEKHYFKSQGGHFWKGLEPGKLDG